MATSQQLQPGFIDPKFGNGGSLELEMRAGAHSCITVDASLNAFIGINKTGSKPENYMICVNQRGELDASFGSAGIARLPTSAYSIHLLPAGKITATSLYRDGESSLNWPAMCRLTAKGQPDLSFGTGQGMEIYDSLPPQTQGYHGLWDDYKNWLIALPNNKFLMFGAIIDMQESASYLLQISENGALDKSFHQVGYIPLKFPGKYMPPAPGGEFFLRATTVCRDDKGRIVFVGMNVHRSLGGFYCRYHADGVIDHGFGNKGFWTSREKPYLADRLPQRILPVRDGKFLIVSLDQFTFGTGVFRLNADFSLDPEFMNQSLNFLDTGVYLGVVKDESGRIILVFSHAVVRLLASGKLDLAFGRDGFAQLPNDVVCDAIAVQGSDILVVGRRIDGMAHVIWRILG